MSFSKTAITSIFAANMVVGGTLLTACVPSGSGESTGGVSEITAPKLTASATIKDDKFTYANYDKIRVTHIDLNLDVNFDAKVLDGTATLDITRVNGGAEVLILDTKDLTIKTVNTFAGGALEGESGYALQEADTVLGQALTIPISDKTDQVKISYTTSPKAEGLQWLSPEQTAGKTHPYLFSQAQALNARTMAPLQDTPAVRMTYSATLRVPDGLRPLMSASQGKKNASGEYRFDMPQPIPSYLIAIAVGDVKFKAINDHIGVYAEEYILEASAEEFAETPLMEASNEALYGPYRWGRYDLIVLPPSFPFGGMENPRLSFMTPTLIAGDKSLTNVVAHELAHSWSGNLVTNSSWRDAWLNEGFTSYVENRVMEDLYGERRAVMEQVLDMEGLKRDIADSPRPELTHLKLPKDLTHPDEAFTLVAYIKGANFLFFLEDRFGREKFDPFLKSYFNDFAFQSITTEDFLNYLNENLRKDNLDTVTQAEIDAWVYGPGLPDTARQPKSSAFAEVEVAAKAWFEGGNITPLKAAAEKWSTHEWLHFINGLPDGMTLAQYEALDAAFSLTGTQNAETAFAWYMQAIKGEYEEAFPDMEAFLQSVGRGKFIYRLYAALRASDREDWGYWTDDVYEIARPGYHPIAQRRIDDILAK